MTRLSSYSTYLSVLIFTVGGIATSIMVFTNKIVEDPIRYFACVPFLMIGLYIVYTSKRVYYNGSELLLYNLFSERCLVIDKAKLVGIEKKSWLLRNSNGNYRINYVDDDNNSKYLDFNMSWTIDNPEELMDKINSVD